MFDINKFVEETCDKLLKDGYIEQTSFLSKTAGGVSYFEPLAVCAFFKLFKVDCIVESGVAYGKSTKTWVTMFPTIPILAVDNFSYNKSHPGTLNKNKIISDLSKYPTVDFRVGDGTKIIPEYINDKSSHKIGVFIDGPKDQTAINLCENLLLNYPQVQFVSIDDLGCNKRPASHQLWTRYSHDKILPLFNTHGDANSWYYKKYSYIDKQVKSPDPRPHGIGFFVRKDWEQCLG